MLPFAFATDIHFDHAAPSVRSAFLMAVKSHPAKVLVVTGDISRATKLVDDLKALTLAQKDVYFILGNHDYYGASIAQVNEYLTKWFRGEADLKIGQVPPNLHYLAILSPVRLSSSEVLIGVNGYADGRAGNLLGSQVWLNDYVVNATFAGCGDQKKPYKLQKILNSLGDESAKEFQAKMLQVTDSPDVKTVYVATHAPPFEEAHYAPDGKLGDAHWAPHFVNTALGDAIKRVAKAAPQLKLVVVCGHTHTGCRAEIADNVTCLVGQADYGTPMLQAAARLPYRTPI